MARRKPSLESDRNPLLLLRSNNNMHSHLVNAAKEKTTAVNSEMTQANKQAAWIKKTQPGSISGPKWAMIYSQAASRPGRIFVL